MSFARFLQPKTIAVIGGREAKEVVRQCKKSGFKGDIWPVHPKKDFVEELKVYRSVEDLPHAPDAAYVAVNRQLSISVIKALAEQGAGGAICYATGFSESGDEGRVLEQQLLEASADMPLLGPNCYGLINNIEKAALWPDQQGGEAIDSGVAIVTQSSNVAINFTMQKRGLPVAYLVSLGNKLKFDLHHAIREFAQLDSVTAIGLYIEGISDPVAFESAVQYARTLGKPVVALKSGRSDTAQKIALSHTASLAGSDDLITALFSRIGVGRAYSIDSLIEALKILHVHGPLSGYKLGVMAPSGGDAILVADEVESTRFELTPLSQLHHDNVTKTVHELVTVSNPFDYQIFDWLNAERLTATYSTFVSEQFDITISIIDYPHEDRCSDSHWMPAEQALINSVESTGAKVVMLSMTLDGMPEDKAKFLMSKGIVPLSGLSAGIEALQAAADIAQVWQNKVAAPLLPLGKTLSDESLQLLDEAEAKQSLAKFNVSIPAHVIVSNAEEVSSAVKKLEFPVVSGNVSFYNESKSGAIPPSPIVSCLGRIQDVNKTIPMHFQKSDSILLMVGQRKDELGGSVYYSLYNELGINLPKPDLKEVKNQIFALNNCIEKRLVLSCHDIADGGVASAVAEMTFGNEIGCDVKIINNLRTDTILFSETGGFILELSMNNMEAVQSIFSHYEIELIKIGSTSDSRAMVFNSVVKLSVKHAKEAWTNGLREKL